MCLQAMLHPADDPEFIKGLEWWIQYVEYQARKEEELLRISYEHEVESFFNLQYQN